MSLETLTATGPGTPFRSLRVERVDPVKVYVATAVGVGDPAVTSRWGAPIGGGVSRQRELAVTKAMAETLERAAAFAQPRAALQYGAMDVVAGALLPLDFPAIDARQELWWVGARRLAEPGTAADSVCLPLERLQLGCPSAVTSYCADTTGLAVHPDRAQAERRAWLEVVERVGTRRLWRARSETVVGPEIFAEQDAALAASVEAAGYEVVCLVDRPLPSMAAVVVLLIGGSGRAGLVCGSGGGTRPSVAAGHALHEAFGQLAQALQTEPLPPGAPLQTAFDHFRYYLEPTRARAMLDAWGIFDAARVSDADALWQRCRAVDACVDPLVVDRGTADADALGLHVVHVVAPRLIAIDRVTDRVRGWDVPFG